MTQEEIRKERERIQKETEKLDLAKYYLKEEEIKLQKQCTYPDRKPRRLKINLNQRIFGFVCDDCGFCGIEAGNYGFISVGRLD